MGLYVIALGMLIKKWWYAILMSAVLWYCVWLFANAVDCYLTGQMNYWGQNLGM